MATRNIVPRGNGEGQLGTSAKHWEKLFVDKINDGADLGNNASIGYRQPNTAYTAGQIAYHSALPTGYYLECTTAGTTGSGDITPSSTIGGTVTDGTLTWTVGQITDKFPVKKPVVSDIDTVLENGIYYVNTATQNKPDSASYAILVVVKADTMRTQKYYPIAVPSTKTRCFVRSGQNGSWSAWQEEEAIVAKSLNINGYIKYASGLIIQWGWKNDTNRTWTYPIAFNNVLNVQATALGRELVVDIRSNTETSISYITTTAGGTIYTGQASVFFFAIGY